jgi:hypothetical protein
MNKDQLITAARQGITDSGFEVKTIGQGNNRGELIVITGTALHVEVQLAKLEQKGSLLSAVYSRSGPLQIIAYAEVIQ